MPLWKFAGPDSYEKVELPEHSESSSLHFTVDKFLRMEGGQLHFEISGFLGFESAMIGVPARRGVRQEGPAVFVNSFSKVFRYSAEILVAIGELSNLQPTIVNTTDANEKPITVIVEDVEDFAARLHLTTLPSKYFVKPSSATNKLSEDSTIVSVSGGLGLTVGSSISSIIGVFKSEDGVVDYSTDYFDELDGNIVLVSGLLEGDSVVVIYETNLGGKNTIPSGNIFTRMSVVSGEVL